MTFDARDGFGALSFGSTTCRTLEGVAEGREARIQSLLRKKVDNRSPTRTCGLSTDWPRSKAAALISRGLYVGLDAVYSSTFDIGVLLAGQSGRACCCFWTIRRFRVQNDRVSELQIGTSVEAFQTRLLYLEELEWQYAITKRQPPSGY